MKRLQCLILFVFTLFVSCKVEKYDDEDVRIGCFTFEHTTQNYEPLKNFNFIPLTANSAFKDVEIPIGFRYFYCGKNYNKIYVKTFGQISFDLGPTDPTATITTGDYMDMRPLYEDALMRTTSVNGNFLIESSIRYNTGGTAGNLVFTIEYKDFYFRESGANNETVTEHEVNFQIKIHETGAIEYHYGQISFPTRQLYLGLYPVDYSNFSYDGGIYLYGDAQNPSVETNLRTYRDASGGLSPTIEKNTLYRFKRTTR